MKSICKTFSRMSDFISPLHRGLRLTLTTPPAASGTPPSPNNSSYHGPAVQQLVDSVAATPHRRATTRRHVSTG
jgi:hypothetical protein